MQWNEVLIHMTAWMSLQNTLSGRSQSQEVTSCMIPFIPRQKVDE